MARFRDFLMRFRAAGTPGPTATGVPADRSAELAAELEPPLSLLQEAEAQARTIRETAAAEAERARRDAGRQAAQIVAAAEDRAADVRREAAARERAAAEADAARFLACGEEAAALLRRRARERMPAAVDRVVADVLRDLDTPREGRPRWAPGGSPG